MQESDQMMLTSLREVILVPQHIKTLYDIKMQQLSGLSLQVLAYFKININDLKAIMKTPQRFRSMTKLNQSLSENLDSQFQLNDLMNPSVPFIRKVLLFFITKISALATQQLKNGLKKNKTQEDQKTGTQSNNQQKNFKSWLKQQWVHPILNDLPKKHEKIHNLHYKFRSQFWKQLENNQNMKDSLNKIIANAKLAQRVRQKVLQQQQGFQRKNADQINRFMYQINDKNKGQWLIGRSNDAKDAKRNKKIKKQLFRSKQQKQVKQQNKNEEISVFKQEVEQIAEDNKIKNQVQFTVKNQNNSDTSTIDASSFQNPIQRLKKQAQSKKSQLQKLLNQTLKDLKARKQYLESLQSQRQKMQQKILHGEEKMTLLKTQNNQFKKQLEKKQILLNMSQNQKEFNDEIIKLEKDVIQLQKQAKTKIDENQQQIKLIQKEGKQKTQILTDLKLKLNKIETDYKRVCEEIQDKQQIKNKVKIVKSGISRLYYSKKISQIQSRWRDTQKQTKKITENLQKMRNNVAKSRSMTDRLQIQIQNLANADKLKSQNETKLFKELFELCQATFKKTVNSLDQINQVKLETHQYETKVHALAGKSYPANIQKLKKAMEDLKKQVNQMKAKRK